MNKNLLLLRILKQALVLILILLPLELLGLIILPVILPFIPKDQEYLPCWLRWYDNHERYTYQDTQDGIDGLAGDKYYRVKHKIYPYTVNYSFWHLLWHRYLWLALRNPLNYFQYKYCGKLGPSYVTVLKGEPNVGDLPGQKQGTRYMELANGAWELYCVKRLYGKLWPKWFHNRGLRVRIGWKITTPKKHYQFCFVINPCCNILSD